MAEQANRGIAEETMVVLLAAGKGTRMGRSDLVKVCFEIDGEAAINRQIAVFKRQRFHRFLVVVGSKAEQVLQTVNRQHSDVLYAYQEPQQGTGHAAKIAADALSAIGHQGYVLVAMGDKHLEPEAVEALVNGFVKQRADFALLTVPKMEATEASVGRVFVDRDGQALDILERADWARYRIAEELRGALAEGRLPDAAAVHQLIDTHLPAGKKQAVAVGELLALVERRGELDRGKLEKLLASAKYTLSIGGKPQSAKQVDRAAVGVNPSLYLMRGEVFFQGVGMLRNDNAQGEYYLTDVVRLLAGLRDAQGAAQYRVRAVPIEHGEWIQGFNSPDELLAIQDYVRQKRQAEPSRAAGATRPPLKANQYATVEQWLAKIEAGRSGVQRWLRNIYGDHEALHRQKLKDLVQTLRCYGKRFGTEEKVCIVRAPGRINLMGRHVDHRGGWTNFLAIDRETIAVCGLREDNHVEAVNTQPAQFKPVNFNIAELIGRFAWSDWVNFVNSDWVRNMVYVAAGDWGNYIKAAMLRLQHRYQDVRVHGINMALSGNVPIAAGLSSSSTIVVATLQAAIALNQFELTSQQFIDLCGEGEWFVGSRGGAGDHAAIQLGQRGKIAHVGYLPFRVEKILDAPAGYQVVIANSHIKAAKSASARHEFNARIAAYNLGLALFKQRCPEVAHSIEHVRDIDPTRLGCAPSEIYRLLMRVPERVTRRDFQSLLAQEHRELIEASFATHAEPPSYAVRGVLLYGAAEILRSRLCVELLQSGQVEAFGRLMKFSHDGDRVARPGPQGDYRSWEQDVSDAYLHALVADLGSEDPHRVLRAQLFMQPGSYACSTPEIDQMVDIASAVPGVVGAQIAGAGLGGCIMALVQDDSVDAVRRALAAQYYRPRALEPAAIPCITVEGAGLVEFN